MGLIHDTARIFARSFLFGKKKKNRFARVNGPLSYVSHDTLPREHRCGIPTGRLGSYQPAGTIADRFSC